jgi:hypothetical protein
MADAQPTEAWTLIAVTGQLVAQAPHSMHASAFLILTFFD